MKTYYRTSMVNGDIVLKLEAEKSDLLTELKTALDLVRLKYGNLDADVWEWQKKTRAMIDEIEGGE